MINVIPEMTHYLSKAWRQPAVSDIEIDNENALMNEEVFKQLMEYSCSQPSGVYEGKMWKSKFDNGWLLCWFGEDGREGYCSNHRRKILLV